MNANYARALAVVLAYEGGFSDNNSDPGGATNKGITLQTLSDFLGRQASVDELKAISPDLVLNIYKARYWDLENGDQLPSGVDLMCFDGAVQHGPQRMATILQAAVGCKPDGIVGPTTINTIHGISPSLLINRLATRRLMIYRAQPSWDVFGNGWTRRLNGIEATSMAWAAKAPTGSAS